MRDGISRGWIGTCALCVELVRSAHLMKTWLSLLPHPLPAWARSLYHRLRAWGLLKSPDPQGSAQPRYELAAWPEVESISAKLSVHLHVRANECDENAARELLAEQTLEALAILGWDDRGQLVYRIGPSAEAAPWFFLVQEARPTLRPSFVESALLLLSAEAVDVVVLADRNTPLAPPDEASELLGLPCRAWSAFTTAAFGFDPRSFAVKPKKESWLAKVLAGNVPMGRYLKSRHDSSEVRVGVQPASLLRRSSAASARPRLLVTVPFFARGGVEHTLYETLRYLLPRFEPIFVSLAPHSPELGDRREDFEALGPRLFSFGDWLHPASMPELLEQLIATYEPFAWYNANGTTLFYDFAARIKARFPQLRILDHLYDHRVGYIEWYGPGLLASVDFCIAENSRIAAKLAADHGWPLERAPVIWGCGRSAEDWPPTESWLERSKSKRRELNLPEDRKILLIAARMHAQKRPLDLPALALRVAHLPVFFLIVGGGPLEQEVDVAIAEATRDGASIRRLPFRTDIPELILAADAGCLVSDYEGLPIFLMECLQAGRPFLGTDVGALGDLLRDTGAGWVIDTPGDLDALAAAVTELADPAMFEARRQKAVEAGSRFGVGPCADRYAEVFLGRTLA